jgi:hypothetical protein
MTLALALVGLFLACGKATSQSDDGTRRFRVEVPTEAASRQTHLLLHDLAVPRNRPVILRVYALAPDSSKIYLGSTALPAVAAEATGQTRIGLTRINVTSGFRRWLKQVPTSRTADLEIRGESPGDTAKGPVPWSLRTVELVHPD